MAETFGGSINRLARAAGRGFSEDARALSYAPGELPGIVDEYAGNYMDVTRAGARGYMGAAKVLDRNVRDLFGVGRNPLYDSPEIASTSTPLLPATIARQDAVNSPVAPVDVTTGVMRGGSSSADSGEFGGPPSDLIRTDPSLLAQHTRDTPEEHASAMQGLLKRAAQWPESNIPDMQARPPMHRDDPTGHNFQMTDPSDNGLQALSAAQIEHDLGANELMNARHQQRMAAIQQEEERNDPMRKRLGAMAADRAYEANLPYGSTSRLQASAGGVPYDIPGVTGDRQTGGMTNEQGARLRQQAALAPENIKAQEEQRKESFKLQKLDEFGMADAEMQKRMLNGRVGEAQYQAWKVSAQLKLAQELASISGERDWLAKPDALDFAAPTPPAR